MAFGKVLAEVFSVHVSSDRIAMEVHDNGILVDELGPKTRVEQVLVSLGEAANGLVLVGAVDEQRLFLTELLAGRKAKTGFQLLQETGFIEAVWPEFVPMYDVLHERIRESAERFRGEWPTSAAVFLPGNAAPAIGSVWKQPDWAETFGQVMRQVV